MNRANELFLEICDNQDEEIRLSDMRPSVFSGATFRRIKDVDDINYFLAVHERTDILKKELRREVGWLRYIFVWYPRIVSAFNSTFYTR